jgi:hypothetical protein
MKTVGIERKGATKRERQGKTNKPIRKEEEE